LARVAASIESVAPAASRVGGDNGGHAARVTPLPRHVFDVRPRAPCRRILPWRRRRPFRHVLAAETQPRRRLHHLCAERTQLGKRPPLSPPTREARRDALDRRGARANLELMRTSPGERRRLARGERRPHVTSAGSRLLSSGSRRRSPTLWPSRSGSTPSKHS